MSLSILDPLSPAWRAVLKRVGDLLVVYGHGLLAFGVGKAFTGAAIVLGVACHAVACYVSLRLEIGA